MSKTKSDIIPRYELLYIISNKYSEDEAKSIVGGVSETIEKNGGKIIFSEEWGKKKLAYPIRHFNYGYYNLVEFNCEGDGINKISRELKINSDILRFQMTAKKIKTEEQIKKQKEISEKVAAKNKQKQQLETEKSKGRVDLKDLDAKLDKILDTDDLI